MVRPDIYPDKNTHTSPPPNPSISHTYHFPVSNRKRRLIMFGLLAVLLPVLLIGLYINTEMRKKAAEPATPPITPPEETTPIPSTTQTPVVFITPEIPPTRFPMCYKDADNDSFPDLIIGEEASGSACPNGFIPARSDGKSDCYDANAKVFPGQTLFFTVQRGDGSFDYNCDGAQTPTGTACYSCTNKTSQIHRKSGGCISAYKYRTVNAAVCGQKGFSIKQLYCAAKTCYTKKSDCKDQTIWNKYPYAAYSCSGSCTQACN